MNYLIFDTDIYYENDLGASGILTRDKLSTLFSGADRQCSVAVIETLQKKLVAPEKIAGKKDEVIASSFTGDYVIESERIAPNVFQAIAFEKSKVTELYKCLGFENVKLVVPYGVALREFLKSRDLFSKNKKVIFLDYIGNEVLLTIFSNDLFTTPRRLSIAVNRVVTELTRSQENYKSLNKEEKDSKFLIATNSKEILEEVKKEGLGENSVYFEEKYPSLKGLRQGKFSMHYMLPEELTRLRRFKSLKKRLLGLGVIALATGMAISLFIGSFIMNKNASTRLKALRLEEASLEDTLGSSYKVKYKDILKSKKKVNIASLVSTFTACLAPEYKMELLTLKEESAGYTFEAIVSCEATNQPIEEFTLPRLFKKARVENIFMKDKPVVRVVMNIL